jgi:DUF1009 family protein
MDLKNIGIIAGGGQFPRLVAQNARKTGAGVFIYGFDGQTDPSLAQDADAFEMNNIGQVGKMFKFMEKHKVTHICMAGNIKKTRITDIKPDLYAAKLLFKLRKNQGDDALLRTIAEHIELEGFSVVQAAELVPGLTAAAGIFTRRAPSEAEMASIRYGWPIGKGLGAYDIGQCLVIKDRMVVAVEALEGTDAALERGGELGGEGCIALKIFKPGQDSRSDLPSIGIKTVEILAKYKYGCLAFEADKTLFFDQGESTALADKHGIAIIGVTPEDVDYPSEQTAKLNGGCTT